MTSLKQMDRAELQMFYEAALKEYESCKAKGLKLDMSRGKPSRAQVALSNDMLNIDVVSNAVTDGIDAFNYGGLDDMQEIFCRYSGSKARAGIRRRQRQPSAYVRYHSKGLYPRSAAF